MRSTAASERDMGDPQRQRGGSARDRPSSQSPGPPRVVTKAQQSYPRGVVWITCDGGVEVHDLLGRLHVVIQATSQQCQMAGSKTATRRLTAVKRTTSSTWTPGRAGPSFPVGPVDCRRVVIAVRCDEQPLDRSEVAEKICGDLDVLDLADRRPDAELVGLQ